MELTLGMAPDPQSCGSDACVTCSDQGIVARVVEVLDSATARVDNGSTVGEISVELLDVSPGDLILVHAKVAIAKLQHSPITGGLTRKSSD